MDDSRPGEVVVYTDYEAHKYIEEGHGEIDLKPGLLSGPNARIGEKGPYNGEKGPYNIVHFRHGTPGAEIGSRPMPVSIYRLMLRDTKRAEATREQGLSSRGGISKVVRESPVPEQRKYKWGHRFDSKSETGGRSKITSRGLYQWKTGKYAGMVRMQQSTSRAMRTQYITFRAVSAASDPASWIVPAVDPVPIRRAAVEFVHGTVDIQGLLRDAIEQDLK